MPLLKTIIILKVHFAIMLFFCYFFTAFTWKQRRRNTYLTNCSPKFNVLARLEIWKTFFVKFKIKRFLHTLIRALETGRLRNAYNAIKTMILEFSTFL